MTKKSKAYARSLMYTFDSAQKACEENNQKMLRTSHALMGELIWDARENLTDKEFYAMIGEFASRIRPKSNVIPLEDFLN